MKFKICFDKVVVSNLSALSFAAILLAFNNANSIAEQNVWSSEVHAEKHQAFHIDDLVGVPGKQLNVGIKLPSSKAFKNASMTFYGMPDSILLSTGVRRAKVWIVPVDQVAELSLIAPAGYKGLFEAAAILRQSNGQVIEGKRFTINISKKNKIAKKKKVVKLATTDKEVVELKPQQKAATEKKMSPSQKAFRALALGEHSKVKETKKKESLISPDLERKLLSKANTLLDNGNIIAARETFKFLASQGHAPSALIIAKTYDPEEFANFDARGILPDLQLAKEWYTKAAQLGSKGAQKRLKEYANAGL